MLRFFMSLLVLSTLNDIHKQHTYIGHDHSKEYVLRVVIK